MSLFLKLSIRNAVLCSLLLTTAIARPQTPCTDGEFDCSILHRRDADAREASNYIQAPPYAYDGETAYGTQYDADQGFAQDTLPKASPVQQDAQYSSPVDSPNVRTGQSQQDVSGGTPDAAEVAQQTKGNPQGNPSGAQPQPGQSYEQPVISPQVGDQSESTLPTNSPEAKPLEAAPEGGNSINGTQAESSAPVGTPEEKPKPSPETKPEDAKPPTPTTTKEAGPPQTYVSVALGSATPLTNCGDLTPQAMKDGIASELKAKCSSKPKTGDPPKPGEDNPKNVGYCDNQLEIDNVQKWTSDSKKPESGRFILYMENIWFKNDEIYNIMMQALPDLFEGLINNKTTEKKKWSYTTYFRKRDEAALLRRDDSNPIIPTRNVDGLPLPYDQGIEILDLDFASLSDDHLFHNYPTYPSLTRRDLSSPPTINTTHHPLEKRSLPPVLHARDRPQPQRRTGEIDYTTLPNFVLFLLKQRGSSDDLGIAMMRPDWKADKKSIWDQIFCALIVELLEDVLFSGIGRLVKAGQRVAQAVKGSEWFEGSCAEGS
ncbi:hypothetical protein C1H76_8628 [Elsinoe australis]|uniref:Uncharacterized protein n=1 Tax=Elsinoe australis TaxID=40998 RepID=A0A4U7ARP0_9PEZI|nr:hypothetical protein C1H76_8628 [Elsinoe australis]